MTPPDVAYHSAAADAFGRLRSMNDEELREIELALFDASPGASDAAELKGELEELPHRAFRTFALGTMRLLGSSMRAASQPAARYVEVLDAYLAGDPAAAAGQLAEGDLKRYEAAGGH